MRLTNDEQEEVTALYIEHKRLVENICKGYRKLLPDEQLEDLTQESWEQVCTKFHTFDKEKLHAPGWIKMVSRSAVSNILRALQADKRAIQMHCISLDALTGNGRTL